MSFPKTCLYGKVLAATLLRGNPGFDIFLEDLQWHRTVFEDHIMEIADVKSVTEASAGVFAKFEYFQHANLVSRRLAGHHDISLDRFAAVAFRVGRIGQQIINRLLTGPLFLMQAGIDDQTRRPP